MTLRPFGPESPSPVRSGHHISCCPVGAEKAYHLGTGHHLVPCAPLACPEGVRLFRYHIGSHNVPGQSAGAGVANGNKATHGRELSTQLTSPIVDIFWEDLEGEEKELVGVEAELLKPNTAELTMDSSACQVFGFAWWPSHRSRYTKMISPCLPCQW